MGSVRTNLDEMTPVEGGEEEPPTDDECTCMLHEDAAYVDQEEFDESQTSDCAQPLPESKNSNAELKDDLGPKQADPKAKGEFEKNVVESDEEGKATFKDRSIDCFIHEVLWN